MKCRQVGGVGVNRRTLFMDGPLRRQVRHKNGGARGGGGKFCLSLRFTRYTCSLAVVVVRLGFRSAPSNSVFVCSLQFLPFAMMNCRIYSYLEPGKPSASRSRKCSLIALKTQPEITPDRSSPPSDEINIENRRYLNSPSDTLGCFYRKLADQAGNGIFMRIFR